MFSKNKLLFHWFSLLFPIFSIIISHFNFLISFPLHTLHLFCSFFSWFPKVEALIIDWRPLFFCNTNIYAVSFSLSTALTVSHKLWCCIFSWSYPCLYSGVHCGLAREYRRQGETNFEFCSSSLIALLPFTSQSPQKAVLYILFRFYSSVYYS